MSEITVDALVRASCYDHVLAVYGDDEGELYLTLYESVHLKEYGRFRLAWQALRGRNSLGAECVFDYEKANELHTLLTDHLDKCDQVKEETSG